MEGNETRTQRTKVVQTKVTLKITQHTTRLEGIMSDAIHGQPMCCDGGSSHCQGAEAQSSSEHGAGASPRAAGRRITGGHRRYVLLTSTSNHFNSSVDFYRSPVVSPWTRRRWTISNRNWILLHCQSTHLR